jgi:hypothetical protein
MKKSHLSDIFKDISVLTKKGDLPKKTFLHPESSKDYYKRNLKGDTEGRSKKNFSFVVPIKNLNERLRDVLWKKLKSILPDLKSFDSREIIDKLEKKYLYSRLPNEKQLNEDFRQKVDKKLEKMDPKKLSIVNKCVNIVKSLTTDQENELVELLKKFELKNTETKTVSQDCSSTDKNIASRIESMNRIF